MTLSSSFQFSKLYKILKIPKTSLRIISLSSSMVMAARAISCELRVPQTATPRTKPAEVSAPARISVAKNYQSDQNGKIMLQPRLCTLRSYGSDPISIIKTPRDGSDEMTPFFANLSEYIESSKKSRDFETISGRLAMLVFAATIATEVMTGNSLFRKMDVKGIAEAAGVCLGAVTCAATFAWFTSARTRVGRMFTVTCNSFIDSLIDQIVDGIFYDSDLSTWSDDI